MQNTKKKKQEEVIGLKKSNNISSSYVFYLTEQSAKQNNWNVDIVTWHTFKLISVEIDSRRSVISVIKRNRISTKTDCQTGKKFNKIYGCKRYSICKK